MNSFERMAPDQIARLALAVCATAEAMGQSLSSDAAELIADDLADYPATVVSAALKSCRRGGGKLTTDSILQRVQAADGRPGKDEAWSIALASSDEFDTVVMTEEIQLALSAARPVLNAGDKVGARMAFISAYERLVVKARTEAKPIQWRVSVGFDPNRRIEAVNAAVQMQRISQERGCLLLADLTHEPITEDGRAVARLLTGTPCQPSEKVRAKLEEIRVDLALRRQQKADARETERCRVLAELDLRRTNLISQSAAIQSKEAARGR